MGGFLNIKFIKKKNGQEIPYFRDVLGRRVRTSMNVAEGREWVTAGQMADLGHFGIQLMLDRVSKGIGSDDAPMPALKQSRKTRWSISQKKVVEYGSWNSGYPAFKQRLGLKPVRDLYGPGGRVVNYSKTTGKKRYLKSGTVESRAYAGGRGHMLDDIRVNYVDEKKVTIDISSQASRTKARANEDRAPWWGWSPSDLRKLSDECARVFGMAVEDRMFTLGFAARSLVSGSGRWLGAARRAARRVA